MHSSEVEIRTLRSRPRSSSTEVAAPRPSNSRSFVSHQKARARCQRSRFPTQRSVALQATIACYCQLPAALKIVQKLQLPHSAKVSAIPKAPSFMLQHAFLTVEHPLDLGLHCQVCPWWWTPVFCLIVTFPLHRASFNFGLVQDWHGMLLSHPTPNSAPRCPHSLHAAVKNLFFCYSSILVVDWGDVQNMSCDTFGCEGGLTSPMHQLNI